ncbi:KH domain-containing protein [Pseudonocardia humida]|uniref:KH domain-containing protein n=1 Tax=Pseudonocardia humida TaxID=2800819 RepID=A0ABT1A665_9PSEU|nr:KH domain-containing protein [Pseudonocardia humida]MCO1658510.1 KH domain-containing protein [Pseudonocardia humida]
MTDDSAFKKQVRARMTETGEKYTQARREVIAGHDPSRPPVTLRVDLASHVDLELTVETARAYAAADEAGRREMANQLLADHIEGAGSGEAGVAADSRIVTGEPRADAEDAAIHGAVQRGIDRAVGVSAVEIGRTADRLSVDIRAARPILLAGRYGAEADRLRSELEELTGRRVRLGIWEVPSPPEGPGNEGSERAG